MESDHKSGFFEKKYQNVFGFAEKVIILHANNQNRYKMRGFNAYYYFYFYFASNCEAGSCV